MKFNKIALKSLLAVVLASALTSCSDIDGDDRFIELPPVVVENIPKYVLLEEYTGQLCLNCPKAHEAISALSEQYGERFIAVGIHCGGTAFSIGEGDVPGLTGLRTAESEQYYSTSSGGGLPCGRVGRIGGTLTYDAWAAQIREEMKLESPIGMSLTPSATEDGQLNIVVEMYSNAQVSGKLQLWIVESGIEALQMQPNGTIVQNYTHNHVFRASVNGFDGENVSVPANQLVHKATSIALKDNWNVENLSVVAFIYNADGVVQAIESHVGESAYNIGSIFDKTELE